MENNEGTGNTEEIRKILLLLNDAKIEKKKLKEEVDKLKREKQKAQKNIKQLEATIKEQRKRYNELEERYEQKMNSYKNELKTLQNKKNEEREKMLYKIEKMREKNEQVITQNEELEKERKRLQEIVENQRREIRDSEVEFLNCVGKIEDIGKIAEEALKKSDALPSGFKVTSANWDKGLDVMIKKYYILEQALNEMVEMIEIKDK